MNDVVIKQTNAEGEEVEQEVSMSDILGIDMNNVEAFEGGFEPTPKGVYRWEVKDAGLDSIESNDVSKAIIYFDLECAECYALVDDSITLESMIGWKHREGIFVSDLAKSVGQAKAIMQNAGFTGSGSLEEMLDAFCGAQFISPVKQRKDKNDTDRVYANLVVGKITPVPTDAAEESATGEAKVGLV